MFKLVCLSLCITSLTFAHECSEEATIFAVKKPIYDFSVRFLDRIAFETSCHFVYSPLSTWLQLMSLVEGAKARSRKEIWEVTGLRGYRKKVCYRRKLRDILNDIDDNYIVDYKQTSAIIVDKLYKVKKEFKTEIEALDNMKVISVDFANAEKSAQEANEIIESYNGYFEDIVFPEDFNQSVLLMTDTAYFKSSWKYPFNKQETKPTPFYHREIEIGKVNMMNQIAYFNYVEIPLLNARVLELPCVDERVSMLLFLPIKDNIIDLYDSLKETTITGVLNQLKIEGVKLVNVSIPRFEVLTEISNVRELLYDMGVKTIFYPEQANLKGISDYTINVSLMTQLVSIEVTEEGVLATSGPENLYNDVAEEFTANELFAFMLVNKKIETILFAGMYSEPSKF